MTSGFGAGRIAIDRRRNATRVVILDRDGVLTYFDLARAARYLAPLVPLPVDAVVRRWLAWQAARVAPTSAHDERALWRGFWDALADELGFDAARRRRLHAFDYTRTMRAFPDARPALVAVRALGIRCVVFSNFSLPSIDASLAACGLGDVIDGAWTGGVVGALKPTPASYRFLLETLSVPADACVVLDDTPANVEGARAHGMRAYHVDRSRAGAPEVGRIRDLRALPDLVRADDRGDTHAAR